MPGEALPGLDPLEVRVSKQGRVELDAVDRLWRAANYLAVGQIYLRGNLLLRRPLEARDVPNNILGGR